MRTTPILALTSFLAAALGAAVPTAAAQDPQGFQKCGDSELTLVFMNPDLRMQEDGYVHASGSFFIQFQARGDSALQVESFKFSMGKPTDVHTCDTPEWLTGAYLKNFRADYEWRDGFHVNINTCNVPDGVYAAAISAYDKDLKELARYWTQAKVENGEGRNKEERCANPDKVAPWPLVLPGDGERLDGGQGLYVEVAEPVATAEAWVNGKRIVLKEGLGPKRDDDLLVDLGYTESLRGTDAYQGQLGSVQYPAFTWDGIIRDGDVIKVRIVDQWGNVAEKIVHLGDPTIGGRATLAKPDFELRIPVTDMAADANGTAVYRVTYVTKSSEGLHADLYVRGEGDGALPDGITYRLSPNHVMMGGNEDLEGTITLYATPDAKLGTYRVQFVANYLNGAAREDKGVWLTFRVDAPPESDATANEDVASGDAPIAQEQVRDGRLDAAEDAPPADAPAKETPFAAPPVALLALAGVAVALRRRAR